jgi:hypothetical protein
MMKNVLIAAFLLTSLTVTAQKSYVFVEEDRYKASKVIDYPDINIDQAYERTLLWFGKNFKNSEEVITSRTSNAIIGRYTSSYPFMASSVTFYHSVKVYFKKNRLKIIIDNVSTESPDHKTLADYCLKNNGEVRGLYKKLYTNFEESTTELIHSLEESLEGNSEMEDW